MSWTVPAALAPFPDTSPLAGLEIAKEVTVSRQILAEPGIDLDRKVWARLADGTPLITADKHEAGDGRAGPYQRRPQLVEPVAVGPVSADSAPGRRL